MEKMKPVYIIGAYSTRFKKWLEKSMKALTHDTYVGVLEDAGMKDGRGHVCMSPLVEEGLFPERVPIINVEGACATASMAFHAAWKDILSGQCDVSLAMGVDKFYHPEMEKVLFAYEQGIDLSDKERLIQEYKSVAQECGREFEFGAGRTIFMDTYAMQACWHMWKWGTTQEQIAIGASKNHYNGSLNPKAQYQFEVPLEKVLEDYLVSYPLTRSMCAPIGDGGAAAILCSEDYLKSQPLEVQKRAVKVLASTMSSGKHRNISEPSLSQWAAERAYKIADIQTKDIDVAEVHDATSFCEIYQVEMLGFCPMGEGGKFIESGATKLDGSIPINTSGGLVSKGHPVGSTGLSMIYEIITQLRGEADARQVKNAEIGLTENGGGVISTEEFACSINIFQRT
jgi:acetyl-CoA acetyltransferase